MSATQAISEYFVRIGLLGRVGRFTSVAGHHLSRGTRVLCRTERGLEVGEVLSVAANSTSSANSGNSELATDVAAPTSDGQLLRAMAAEDELVAARLQKNRESAYEACQELLRAEATPCVLVDVEPLFDGSRIYFYFLGEVPDASQSWVTRLADAFESQVGLADFTAALEKGCGPDCGTEAAAGCGDSCGSCGLASSCPSPRS